MRFSRQFVNLVLKQPVWPSDADSVDGAVFPQTKVERNSVINPLLIRSACFNLHCCAWRQLEVLDSLQTDIQPMQFGPGTRDLVYAAVFTNRNYLRTAVKVKARFHSSHARRNLHAHLACKVIAPAISMNSS